MRRLLAAALALAIAAPLLAPGTAAAEDANRRPPRPARRAIISDLPSLPALGPGQAAAATAPAAERAPVPNREIEPPPATRSRDQASLMPDLMQRNMPGRSPGQAGLENRREDRLFTPGPGARLRLPFSF